MKKSAAEPAELSTMSSPHEREVTVFEAALQLPPEQREAYLQRTCEGDESLLQRVRSLLNANAKQTDFLASPTGAAVSPAPSEKPGDRIGPYKLLQLIGEGGCGVVYMAEQDKPFHRRVALKIIKLGMDTKQVIARFEAERQALALMDHPNIAKVHDAGSTATGRPYFVMELVRGVKITDYCDEKKLTTRQRLELFIQVCQAVQHAHQKGIIHRDLKPSNILVTVNDGAAVVKVIDFGIAKATTGERLTDKTLFTAFEQFIGTPAYVSPEQAEITSLDIDTRSDIYSMGVLLYELLTGQTPFDTKKLLQAGLDEMRRTLRETEPPTPSTRLSTVGAEERTNAASRRGLDAPKLVSLLRGDLDWIVMKCLEKDRTRRYETANSLATDIHRYLNNEPVEASPPSGLYRLRKLVRRNKAAFAAVGVIGMVLLLGIVTSSWEAVRARRAEREQTRLRQLAERAQSNEANLRSKAEAGERKVGIEAAKSEQVARFLEDMLEGVGPSVARGRDTTMLREILDKTAERAGKDLTNQPEVEIELRTVLAETYLNLELPRQAGEIASKALERSRLLYGETNLVTARLLVDLGWARFGLQDPDSAVSFLRRGLAIQRELLPHDHPAIAHSLDVLANTLRRFFTPREAEATQREALEIRKRLFGNRDRSLVDSLNNMGLVLSDLGRRAEAEACYREALEIAEEESPGAATALARLGRYVAEEGRLGEGIGMMQKAIDIDRKVRGPESQELSWHLLYLGRALASAGKLPEAEAVLRSALAINRKVWADRPRELVFNLSLMNGTLMGQRKYEELERLYDEVLTPEMTSNPQLQPVLQQAAEVLARRGHWDQAATMIKKLMELQPGDHWNYHMLAPVLVAMGNANDYHQLCQNIVAQFGDVTNAVVADRMAKDCLVLPNSGVDPVIVGKMAQTALDVGMAMREMPYFECTKSLAEYRRGYFANAAEWAQKSIDNPEFAAVNERFVQAYSILAMARFQSRQHESAQAALASGLARAEKMASLETGDIGGAWRDWVIARTLLAEAKELLAREPAPDLDGNSQSNVGAKAN